MIDFTPLISVVIEIAASLLMIFAILAVRALQRKFNIEADEKMNGRINEAIERAIDFAEAKLKEKGKGVVVDTKHEAVAEAVNYVIAGVPKAIGHFGLTPERIAEMVEARFKDKL